MASHHHLPAEDFRLTAAMSYLRKFMESTPEHRLYFSPDYVALCACVLEENILQRGDLREEVSVTVEHDNVFVSS